MKELLKKADKATVNFITTVEYMQTYSSNEYYRKKYTVCRKDFKNHTGNLVLELRRAGRGREEEEIEQMANMILGLVKEDSTYTSIVIGPLKKFRKMLIDIEKSSGEGPVNTLTVPAHIPECEPRRDLKEAIDVHQLGHYLPSQVMCRRAFEGALRECYYRVEGVIPIKNWLCPKCGGVAITNKNLSVTEMHRWAVDKNIIHEKFKNIGLLVPELASGAAHPTKKPIPRDEEVSKLTIQATAALLTQLYPVRTKQ